MTALHKSQPKFSVITAVFNRAKTLQRCIDSVLSQSYPNVEHIVIDGGSSDGSVDILHRNGAQLAHWISEKDKGIYDAWNKGVAKASGDWLYFLGADDALLNPQVLEHVAERLSALESNVRVVYGKVALASPSGKVLEIYGTDWEIAKPQFFVTNSIPHQGVFHHCSLFEEFGNFDLNYKIAGDYEFLLRELKYSDRNAVFLKDLTITAMEIGGVSSNIPARIRTLKEMAAAREKNGLLPHPKAAQMMMIKAYTRLGIEKFLGEKLSHRIVDTVRRATGRPPIWTIE